VGASVSENQLQDFIIDGKDLSPEVKSQLATYLYARPVTFDAELDLLVDTHSEPAPFCTITPAPWVNPDSKIAAAQKSLSRGACRRSAAAAGAVSAGAAVKIELANEAAGLRVAV
jgi:hypothetical protein